MIAGWLRGCTSRPGGTAPSTRPPSTPPGPAGPANPAVLHTAQACIATDSFTAERDHLAAHPELLAADATVAVDEALLNVSNDSAQRYRAIRAAAQTDGIDAIDAAYRPVLLSQLGYEFAGADLSGKQALLHERPGDLLDDTVSEVLTGLAGDNDDTTSSRGTIALAVLDLARLGEHQPALDALGIPGGLTALLTQLAAIAPTGGCWPAQPSSPCWPRPTRQPQPLLASIWP